MKLSSSTAVNEVSNQANNLLNGHHRAVHQSKDTILGNNSSPPVIKEESRSPPAIKEGRNLLNGDNSNIKLVEEEELRREGSRGEKFFREEEIAEWSEGIAATEIDITEEMRSGVAECDKAKANEIIGEMMATKGRRGRRR